MNTLLFQIVIHRGNVFSIVDLLSMFNNVISITILHISVRACPLVCMVQGMIL